MRSMLNKIGRMYDNNIWKIADVHSTYMYVGFAQACPNDCREGRGVIYRNSQSVSIPFLFLSFFHRSKATFINGYSF